MLRFDNPQPPPLPKLTRPEEILAAIQDFLAPVFARNPKLATKDPLCGVGILLAEFEGAVKAAGWLGEQLRAAKREVEHLESRLAVTTATLASRDAERQRILDQAMINSNAGRREWAPPARS